MKLSVIENFFKSHKTVWLFSTLVLLTLILAVTTYFHPGVFLKAVQGFQGLTSQLADGSLFKEKSSAKVWTENGSLKVQFNLTLEDREIINSFNQKLGAGNSYLDGISIDLDDKSIQSLEAFLPLHVTLKVTPDQVSFNSGVVKGFASSLIKETTEVSSGSGQLKLEKYSANEFSLHITDPKPLLKHATASGQFVLSDKLQPMFLILDKVGTIELNINGKSVSGNISVK